ETNGEDVVEYIENFSSEWFKEECIGWVTTWEDLTEKFFGKIYPPSRTNSKMKADERMKSDDDVTNNEEPCDDREKDPDEENEIAKIFRIETDLFEYETPICKDDGYCNGGNLPGRFRVGNTIQYQDYEWYEALEDNDLKDEALRNKAALEESINQEKESSNKGELNKSKDDDIGYLDNYLVNRNALFNEEEERWCKLLRISYVKPPVCKIERFEVIKYSFGPDEKYVAIKEYEHDDSARTKEDVCHAYQEIFRKMDEG
ncbi:hypothetical protein Tco_0904396, partial [Tanacetum coccineum]